MVMKLRTPQPDAGENGGKCVGFPVTPDNDPWFEEEDEAIAICNGWSDGVVCPNRHECLIFSLINNEAFGVWGGMYADDRATLRRFTPKEEWVWRPPSPRDDSPE
jgi:hypothetical protein